MTLNLTQQTLEISFIGVSVSISFGIFNVYASNAYLIKIVNIYLSCYESFVYKVRKFTEQIEKDIREKIDANRQNVLLAFVACDATGNGRVSQKKFRQILEKFSLPLSDEHFNK